MIKTVPLGNGDRRLGNGLAHFELLSILLFDHLRRGFKKKHERNAILYTAPFSHDLTPAPFALDLN